MKNLIFLSGTMGVGKTAAGQALKRLLPDCAFLDGDWCWDMDPFVVTEETRRMVVSNAAYLLQSFLSCSVYQNVVFCWDMHEERIADDILSRLRAPMRLFEYSLICSPEALTARIQKDVARGVRTRNVLERSLARLPNYARMRTVKIDVSARSAQDAARLIAAEVLGADCSSAHSPLDGAAQGCKAADRS